MKVDQQEKVFMFNKDKINHAWIEKSKHNLSYAEIYGQAKKTT